MAFDYIAMMNDLFPGPKPGEWVPVEYGLPKEFETVVFAVDDGSAEGMLYMGWRQGDTFRIKYMEMQTDPIQIGGSGGVWFWMRLPHSANLFQCPY